MTSDNIVMAVWLGIIAVGAVSDIRSYRIPNVIPLALVALFGLAHFYWGFNASLWDNIWHFGIALAVGMFLFGLRWIGGGDAKFYAAVALWFNIAGGALLIGATGLAGLILAIFYLLTRKMAGNRKDRRIPYGAAIGLGAVIAASILGFSAIFPGK